MTDTWYNPWLGNSQPHEIIDAGGVSQGHEISPLAILRLLGISMYLDSILKGHPLGENLQI
jgi:hypothetical protein